MLNQYFTNHFRELRSHFVFSPMRVSPSVTTGSISVPVVIFTSFPIPESLPLSSFSIVSWVADWHLYSGVSIFGHGSMGIWDALDI